MQQLSSRRPPRLAIVVTARVTASSFVLKFAEYIASNGYEVTIIADGLERSSHKIGKGSLSIVPVAMSRYPHPLKDLRSLVSLTKQLRIIKPHILTYATPKASLLGSIAGFSLRIPVRVYQLWGLRLETTSGVRRTILALLEKLTSLLSTKIVANSLSLATKYTDLNLNAGRRVETLGRGSSHGVDLDRFSRNATYPELDRATSEHLRSSRRDLVVGFIGRLHPDKGIHTLLDSLRIVRAEGVSISLVLVGNDEGAELDLSDDLINDTVVAGQVNDPRPYYAAIDVLILPSLREGFPNVVLEAAAMSVPAIVSNGTGVIDSVVDGVTGFVVPMEDAPSLARSIRRLATERDLRNSLGDAARDRAEDFFEQKQVWKRTLDYLVDQSDQ